MLVRLATLALLATLAAGSRLVFPDTTSSEPALGSRIGSARCPYPLPFGATRDSLTPGCYDVTDEEDLYVLLSNADDSQCSQNHVRTSDGRCVKVRLRAQPSGQRKPQKPSKGPEGRPNWDVSG